MIYRGNWIDIVFLATILQTAFGLNDKSTGAFKINYEVRRGNSVSDSMTGAKGKFVKRDNSLDMELTNQRTFYVSSIDIGSNSNENLVLVDTGSSDFWVMASDVECYYSYSYRKRAVAPKELRTKKFQHVKSSIASSSEDCLSYGSYQPDDSDSYKVDNEASYFYIQYMDGTYAYGTWGYDTIKISDVEVENMYFAVANESASDIGVLGIGPKFQQNSDRPYSNLPFLLKDQGIINKVAYSVYLDEADSDTGTVLFGAVDKSKYVGTLGTLPVIEDDYYGNPMGLQVLLSGIYFSDGNGEVDLVSSYTIATLVDTGTTFSYLPSSIIDNIAERLDASYSSYAEAYYVDCEVISDWELIFDFNGHQIRAPVSSFIIEGSNGYCYLSIFESNDIYILGDNFLRNTYMVIDLEGNEISLAQAKYSDEEDIEVISSSVPDATRVPNYSNTLMYESITSTVSISAKSGGSGSTTKITESESFTRRTAGNSDNSASSTDSTENQEQEPNSTSTGNSESTSRTAFDIAGTIQAPAYLSTLFTILAVLLIV